MTSRLPYDPKDESIVLARILPVALRDSAVILDGEFSWSYGTALNVATWAGEAGFPVLGVEIWRQVGEHPKWIASSSYPDTHADRFTRAKNASEQAKQFMGQYRDDPLALFNMTWDLSGVEP